MFLEKNSLEPFCIRILILKFVDRFCFGAKKFIVKD